MDQHRYHPSRTWRLLPLGFALLSLACSSGDDPPLGDDGATGGGGSGGQSAASGGGGAACPPDTVPAKGDLSIIIDNQKTTPIYYRDGTGDWELCELPYDIDFANMPDAYLETWPRDPVSCDRAYDCNPGAVFEIPAGATVTLSWDGLLDEYGGPECGVCLHDVAPAPNATGELSVTLFEGPCSGDFCDNELQLSETFAYAPGASVTFAIGP